MPPNRTKNPAEYRREQNKRASEEDGTKIIAAIKNKKKFVRACVCQKLFVPLHANLRTRSSTGVLRSIPLR